MSTSNSGLRVKCLLLGADVVIEFWQRVSRVRVALVDHLVKSDAAGPNVTGFGQVDVDLLATADLRGEVVAGAGCVRDQLVLLHDG